MKYPVVLIAMLIMIGADLVLPGQTIDPDHFDAPAMKTALHEKTNKYRSSKRKGSLKLDKQLTLAAQDHADYVMKNGKLTHNQTSENKKGPKERIRFYGGDVKAYAENIADLMVQRPCSVYNAKGEIYIKTLRTYDEVAVSMINAWNASEGHKRNLTSEDYTKTGFGVAYNPKSRKVTVVQVFGG